MGKVTKQDEENLEQDSIETKYLEATIEKASDGSFTAVASTNRVDRQGEIVDNNGWDLKSFKKNPVILWGHDHNEPAIGVAKRVWVDGAGKKAKLMIQPMLHDVTEKARAIKALVDMGVIRTLSVGFKPLESPDGVTFTKNELLEVSMVNVPANADAMMLAYKGLKSKGFEDKTLEELGISHEIGELVDKVDFLSETVEELQTTVKALSVNPSKKQTEQRLSHLKIIARATDKILEADKKNVDVKPSLIKVIKRTTEILTVAEKERLNG